MLVLVFYLGDNKYMTKYDKIREISPMVVLKKIPHSPDYFAGFLNYRGMVVPVIDLCQLIQGQVCQIRMSTRIILVDYTKEDSTQEVFGFIAERVTEAVRKPENAFVSSGVNMQETLYLKDFVMEQEKMIQCIDLELLSNQFHFQSTLLENNNIRELITDNG